MVVDFVGNVELSSRKSSKVENTPNEILGESALGSSLSSSPTASPCAENDITRQSSIEHHDSQRQTSDEGYVGSTVGDDDKLQPTTTPSVSEDEQPKTNENKQHENSVKVDIHLPQKKIAKDENVVKEIEEVKDTVTVKDVIKVQKRSDSPPKDEKPVMRRSSPALEKSARPNSIVMQNKMLFDQQISAQTKRKPSVESQDSQRSSRENSFRGKRSSSIKSLNERPVSGTVAGTRTMFEGGNTSPVKSISSRKSSLKTVKDAENTNKEEIPHGENPLLQSFKTTEVIKSSKKKRFPFKKKKSSKLDDSPTKLIIAGNQDEPTNDVELLKIHQSVNDGERSIDITPEMNTESDKTEQEKKKKGIFSRMRKPSRKGSESSDGEQKPSQEKHHSPVKRSSSNSTETPKENEITVQHDVQQDLTLNLSANDSKEGTRLPTPEEPPPSPGYASSEIKSVLENIIDRKPSYNSIHEESIEQTTPKKKRLGLKLKKKSSSKKEKESKVEKVSPAIPNEEMAANKSINVPEHVQPSEHVEDNKDVDRNEQIKANEFLGANNDEIEPSNEKNESEEVETNEKVDTNNESSTTVNEDESTHLIQTGAVISDWPSDESEKSTAVENKEVDIIPSVQATAEDNTHQTTEQNVEDTKHQEEEIVPKNEEENDEEAQDKPETITIGKPTTPMEKPETPTITLTVASDENLDAEHNDTLDLSLDNRGDTTLEESTDAGSPPFSDTSSMNAETSSINTNASSPDKKKKKLHFHFPKRKSKKKDKDKEKHDNIWEETSDKESKKLKRPKSLDFLAGKIHPKSKNEKNRPVSMLPGEIINDEHHPNDSIQKSPKLHKKKSFNPFKKKKNKQSSEPLEIPQHDSNLKDAIDAPPSPITPSPDAFTIPELDASINSEHDHGEHKQMHDANTNGTSLSANVSL